ncbi:ferritin-like domain-containing protein [Amycolatopsis samaneae]|uniref:Ferritin-like protein n=1 Tax=Amycolatopsis samaneae TaxID=664691 RepID=A0ABW5GRH5_9PSEU
MSYLGYPRLNFAGTFQADVDTANNPASHHDNNVFEPRFQWRLVWSPDGNVDVNGQWNPRGTNDLRFTDVRVTSVYDRDGRIVTSPSEDPVVGSRVTDDDRRPHGKFVDLDPHNQLVTELFGVRLRLVDRTGREALRGDFVPSSMTDLFPRAQLPTGRPDMSATYQSVLTGLEWGEGVNSPFLRALRSATQENTLSIKFTTDGVEDGSEHWPDNVTFGRIVGSLGPYRTGEPKRLVAGRRLRKFGAGRFNHAPCRVDEQSGLVFVDLGNSVPATSRGGPLVEVGALFLAVLTGGDQPRVVAPLDGVGGDFYRRDAGIVTARLDPGQRALVAGNRLAVTDGTGMILLAENHDATMVQADGQVFRLYPRPPHDTVGTVIHATRFGLPAAGVRIFVGTGQPPRELTVPALVVTDERGRAPVTITGTDPGNPRRFIDGSLTALHYGFPDRPTEPEGRLMVRVFDLYRAPRRPTWVRDVQPIFQRYANLVPVMHDVLDLGNYHEVTRHADYIRRTLLADVHSPNHMPATRDLSPGKRDMIVNWLNTTPAPPVLEIESPADLRDTLQQALLVELATIPPYLAALFSVKPGHNLKIAELIRGVVLEEMQHLAQVCNILNAVGGKPQIGRPGFVPTYPGRLPGPVLPDLRVRLRRLSIEHVRDVFMAIERPAHPTVDGRTFRGRVIDPASVRLDRAGAVLSADEGAMRTLAEWFERAEYTPMTIGWFYNRIARAIIRLDREGRLFTGDPATQVSWPDAPGLLYKVTDRRSALLGIYQIVEQGEGSPHDLNGDGLGDPNELGHYYRFAEIVEGRQLARDDRGRWAYTGPEIPFDPNGVYPVVDDADTYRSPIGSVARRESIMCDESYTRLLTALHRVFNGHSEGLDDTVGLMFQLQLQAKKLYGIRFDEHTVLGPAFQSPGVKF